jgi:hypothetical protein
MCSGARIPNLSNNAPVCFDNVGGSSPPEYIICGKP